MPWNPCGVHYYVDPINDPRLGFLGGAGLRPQLKQNVIQSFLRNFAEQHFADVVMRLSALWDKVTSCCRRCRPEYYFGWVEAT